MTAAPPDIEHDDIAIEAGPGKRLHEARRAAGLSIADVAAQLHLDAATIEALEQDNYAKLPAPAFVRGYLRSYARLLNLAPGPVVDAYSSRGFEPPALVADISSGTQAQSESTDLPWRLMTYLIAGIVVTLVVMWWRSNMSDPFSVLDEVVGIGQQAPDGARQQSDTSLATQAPASPSTSVDVASAPAGEAQQPAPPDAAPQTPAPPPSFQSVVVPAPESSSSAAAGTAAAPAAATVDAVLPAPPATALASSGSEAASSTPVSPETVDAAAVSVATAMPETAAASPETPSGELRLAFTHDSWVEVYDASNERLFFGMARAGREMNLRGKMPLRVLLGYARDIRVEYNGGLLDYAAFVNRGIARFIVTDEGIRGEPGEPATAQQ